MSEFTGFITTDGHNARWRVGRSVGRTIYRMVGDEPSDADELIGVMDTAELARQVVDSVNADIPDECDEPGWDERTQNAPGRYGA